MAISEKCGYFPNLFFFDARRRAQDHWSSHSSRCTNGTAVSSRWDRNRIVTLIITWVKLSPFTMQLEGPILCGNYFVSEATGKWEKLTNGRIILLVSHIRLAWFSSLTKPKWRSHQCIAGWLAGRCDIGRQAGSQRINKEFPRVNSSSNVEATTERTKTHQWVEGDITHLHHMYIIYCEW